MDELDERQKLFVEEYLKCGIPKEAALKAGYSAKNPNAVAVQIMGRKKIKAAIQRRQAELATQAETQANIEEIPVTKERVISELAKIAFSDIRDFMTWGKDTKVHFKADVEVKDSSCISEIVLNQNGLRFKLYDKKAALELLCRILGLLNDKVIHSGKIEHDHFGYGNYTSEQLMAEASKVALELEAIANANGNGNGNGSRVTPSGNGHKKGISRKKLS